MRIELKSEFQEVFKEIDVLVSPTLSVTTPAVGQINDGLFKSILRLTGPANLTGLTAASIPCGFIEGMPVGMQIMGSYYNEVDILNVAYALG